MFQVDVFHKTSLATFSAICTVFIEMKLLLLLLLKISNAIKQQTPEKTARTGKIILTVFILVAAISIFIRKRRFTALFMNVMTIVHISYRCKCIEQTPFIKMTELRKAPKIHFYIFPVKNNLSLIHCTCTCNTQ